MKLTRLTASAAVLMPIWIVLVGSFGYGDGGGVSAFVPLHTPHHEHKLTTPKTPNKEEKGDALKPSVPNKEPVLEKDSGKQKDPLFCIPLEEICLNDLPKVGGKTASLGEMIQQLQPLGVAIPGGFAVSSSAYDAVLDRFQLRERLQFLLKDIDGKLL